MTNLLELVREAETQKRSITNELRELILEDKAFEAVLVAMGCDSVELRESIGTLASHVLTAIIADIPPKEQGELTLITRNEKTWPAHILLVLSIVKLSIVLAWELHEEGEKLRALCSDLKEDDDD